MSDGLEFAARATAIGIGATLLIDAWALLLKRLFGIQSLNFGMVGRWLGHLAGGRFRHAAIAQAAPVRGELAVGWIAHYAIGVAFAAGLIAVEGLAWARQPTFPPALAFGVATVLFPFLVMQPGMGAGFAASRTPDPARARLRSVLTHAVFGIGLYGSAALAARF
ncbi:hypothetical protein ASG87_10775 [Frateuria sp. Soil773]|uniref:DUF2938 domain-containing protein n=1 Tax=Frateuria sp. Soil773 TaxID=1736407 RepID=UPI0006FF84F9|nr:DUF2938 domain-containing protein [Frateuria sp. Soil773]KRF01976.1 hypothetical protein ASG87_10775 [Frateuria sp. Soil773]